MRAISTRLGFESEWRQTLTQRFCDSDQWLYASDSCPDNRWLAEIRKRPKAAKVDRELRLAFSDAGHYLQDLRAKLVSDVSKKFECQVEMLDRGCSKRRPK